MISLQGKTALVTGAGVRLGRAISEELGRQGCRLILHCNASRRSADEVAQAIRASGGAASVLQADLSVSGAAKDLAAVAEKTYGGVDILVNNAAVFWPTALEELDETQLDAFYALNLRAPFVLSSEIGRAMKARGTLDREGGVILNMACLSGLRSWKTHVPYSISKAGIVSMTQGMAKLLGPEVRVNAIAPGTVLPPEHASAQSIEALRNNIPLKRIGSTSDVVAAALYALTSPFVTGQILCVDGGRGIQ